jgi:hypothetical protein
MRHCAFIHVGSLLLAFAFFASAKAEAPLAVAAARSVDELLSAFRYLGPMVGQEALTKKVDAFITAQRALKTWDAVGLKRPLGVYMLWPPGLKDFNDLFGTDVTEPPIVLFFPIADEKGFLELLRKLQLEPKPGKNGSYQMTIPNTKEVHLRFAHGYAYLANHPIDGPLPEPATLLPAATRDHSFVATIHLDRIPKEVLDSAARVFEEPPGLGHRVQTIKPLLEGQLSERDFQQLLENTFSLFYRVAEPVFFHAREFSVNADVLPNQNQFRLTATLLPRSDGQLAAFCRYAEKAATHFAYLNRRQDSVSYFTLPPATEGGPFQKTVEGLLEGLPYLRLEAFDDAAVRKAIQIVRATLVTDGLDFCQIESRRPGEQKADALIAMKVRNGRQLDHLLRDILKNSAVTDRNQFAFRANVERYRDARIHKLALPRTWKADWNEVFLAIRDDVVFLSSAADGLQRIKAALDDFPSTTPAPSPLFHTEFSPASLFQGESPGKSAAEKLYKNLPESDRQKMRGRVTLDGGAALRMQMEIDPRLVQLVYLAVFAGGEVPSPAP